MDPAEREKLERFLSAAEAEMARIESEPATATRGLKASRLLRDIEEVRAALETLPAEKATEDPRRIAQEILSQPEFQTAPPKPTTPPKESWLKRLLKRLFRQRRPHSLNEDMAPGIGAGPFGVLAWILVIGGVLAILGFFFRTLTIPRHANGQEPSNPSSLNETALLDPTARSPLAWLSDAEAAAQAGDFKRAVRALYLALLSTLSREGRLRYDPGRTNWEYVRMFRGSPEEQAALRRVTFLSDGALYGNLNLSAHDYEEARRYALELVREGEGA